MGEETKYGGGLCGNSTLGLIIFIYTMVAFSYVNGLNVNEIQDSSYLGMISWIKDFAIGQIVIECLSFFIIILMCCGGIFSEGEGSIIAFGFILLVIVAVASIIYNIVFVSIGYPLYVIVNNNCTIIDLENLYKCKLLNEYYAPILIIVLVVLSISGVLLSCLSLFGCCLLSVKCLDN